MASRNPDMSEGPDGISLDCVTLTDVPSVGCVVSVRSSLSASAPCQSECSVTATDLALAQDSECDSKSDKTSTDNSECDSKSDKTSTDNSECDSKSDKTSTENNECDSESDKASTENGECDTGSDKASTENSACDSESDKTSTEDFECDTESDETSAKDSVYSIESDINSADDSDCDTVSVIALPLEDDLTSEAQTQQYNVVDNIQTFTLDFLQAIGAHIISHLGKDHSGKAVLIKREDKPWWRMVIRRFPRSSQIGAGSMSQFYNEVEIVRQLAHPSVLSNIIPIQCPKYAAIAMPYFNLGSMDRYVSRLYNFHELLSFFDQLMGAVRYIHYKKIIHRDIKLSKLLITSPSQIQLYDFGHAKKVTPDGIVTGKVGTSGYMAPEVERFPTTQEPYNGFLADAYSVGVVLRAFLLRSCPGEDEELDKGFDRNPNVEDPFLQHLTLCLLREDAMLRECVVHVEVMLLAMIKAATEYDSALAA